ncbi:MAG: hypothetical protein UX87_C0050G0002 [Candidatus Amesbacteria bacterium GW2011_GWA1_47_16]|uniref:Adenylate kinase n=1 Tax=Candidatus Amesbacteria bacterium GW2011_GWA1_47_16 TaxID=1618353 RepID=A0A0G1RZ56_9BACT|nr:MAG: hypothetical protein UX87_C0050G0002 [Candidatus Amesbacteria bacterium GW2011_GWA1_47_16]
MEFPLNGTKVEGLSREFDLADYNSRQEYFEAKAGLDIIKIRDYLKNRTFVAYLVGKKASGKGTRIGMFAELFGEKIVHIGVGDIVRGVHSEIKTTKGWDELKSYLEKNYRGYISPEEGMKAISNRTQDKVSVPNELMLSLIKREIAKYPQKSVFLDGFPRTLDQVSYSLFFRELMGYRDDPDVFILVDTPLSVIDERIKYRIVCPICKISRNMKLHITRDVDFNSNTGKYVMHCDNPACERAEMIAKEGDEMGIEPISGRLEKDEGVLRSILGLHGVPKILLRTHVPVEESHKYFDNYEITPEYVLSVDKKTQKVRVEEKPWTIRDDNGVLSHSLIAAVDVVLMVRQLVDVLNL